MTSFLAQTALFEAVLGASANGAIFAQSLVQNTPFERTQLSLRSQGPPSFMQLDAGQTRSAAQSPHAHFDFSKLSARDRYKLLIGTVIPRPIAFVTTIDERGVVNAAPFSFFNCLSSDPAIVAVGVENHPDMRHKDTGHNVRVTEEFTVNIVDDALVAGMNVCAVPFPADVDELAMAGLTAVKGVHVGCPRIAEAPAALECRRYMTIEVGKSREIILGLVLGCFIREGVVNPITKHVDQRKMDAIGRLGGHGYSRSRDQFDLPTMSVDEWRRRGGVLPRADGED